MVIRLNHEYTKGGRAIPAAPSESTLAFPRRDFLFRFGENQAGGGLVSRQSGTAPAKPRTTINPHKKGFSPETGFVIFNRRGEP
jgi:hypothetical protein